MATTKNSATSREPSYRTAIGRASGPGRRLRKTDNEFGKKGDADPKKAGRRATATQASLRKPQSKAKAKPILNQGTGCHLTSNDSRGAHTNRQFDAAEISFRSGSKSAAIVELLKRDSGATIAELTTATDWQAHSVRGFVSGTLKKKHGLAVIIVKGDDGERRYRIVT